MSFIFIINILEFCKSNTIDTEAETAAQQKASPGQDNEPVRRSMDIGETTSEQQLNWPYGPLPGQLEK